MDGSSGADSTVQGELDSVLIIRMRGGEDSVSWKYDWVGQDLDIHHVIKVLEGATEFARSLHEKEHEDEPSGQ